MALQWRQLYLLKVQLEITPNCVGLSEDFRIVVVFEQAHTWIMRNSR